MCKLTVMYSITAGHIQDGLVGYPARIETAVTPAVVNRASVHVLPMKAVGRVMKGKGLSVEL